MFGNYSKLIGAVVGNIVGLLFVWAASAGFGECTMPADGAEQVCTVLGFTTAQVTGAVMFLINSAFVFFFPANKPAV